MTEVSDFGEKMGGAGPVGLPEMQATAAWQAAWGVTEFTLYYGLTDRPIDVQRAYGDYVGRLNAVLKPARRVSDVLLYYPIYDLWAEYKPVAQPLNLGSQSARAQRIVNSFNRWGQSLQRNQVPFTLVDHESLAAMSLSAEGRLVSGKHAFRALVLPVGVELPEAVAKHVEEFGRRGGIIVRGEEAGTSPSAIQKTVRPRYTLSPANERIALGEFDRDGKAVLLVVNVGGKAYEGTLQGEVAGEWQSLDPASGEARPIARSGESISLNLPPRQATILVRQ
jgi:hypothetical protein